MVIGFLLSKGESITKLPQGTDKYLLGKFITWKHDSIKLLPYGDSSLYSFLVELYTREKWFRDLEVRDFTTFEKGKYIPTKVDTKRLVCCSKPIKNRCNFGEQKKVQYTLYRRMYGAGTVYIEFRRRGNKIIMLCNDDYEKYYYIGTIFLNKLT